MPTTLPPEARELQGRPAGLASRFLASSFDYVVAIVLTLGAWLGVAAVHLVRSPTRFAWPSWTGGTFVAVYLGVLVLSLAIPWATTGRCAGKALFGLRLVTRHGHRVGPLLALARAVLCVAFPFGLFWTPFGRENRSLHDLICRTAVEYDWTRKVPARRVRDARAQAA